MHEGTRARERFIANMRKVAVGARLARRRVWVVTEQKRWDTSVELTMQSGRRTFHVNVPISHVGPDLWDAGLRFIASAPSQGELIS